MTAHINMPVYSLNYAAMTKGKTTKEEKQQALKDELLKQINGLIKQYMHVFQLFAHSYRKPIKCIH